MAHPAPLSSSLAKAARTIEPVTAIEAFHLKIPLRRPYRLSLGTLEAFESVVVRMRAGDHVASGEATELPGYFSERIDDVWRLVLEEAPLLVGKEIPEAISALGRLGDRPFPLTPLLTPLETLGGIGPILSACERPIPLVATVQAEEEDDLAEEIARFHTEGYRTLKVKVGGSHARDLRYVKRVQRLADSDFTIRIDANQGCTFTEAEALLAAMDPAIVEHFEQPFPPDRWEEMATLQRTARVPLMLDESIRGREDLERVIQTGCAGVVKFKLMRAGGFRALAELIGRARQAGLSVILGNGVATDLGCLQEARLAISMGLTERAGEMNGFLKASRSILTEPLRVERGVLRLPAEAAELLDPLAIREFAVESRRWGAGIG